MQQSFLPTASTENITVIISFSCTIILTVTGFNPFVSVVMLFGTWKKTGSSALPIYHMG